MYKSEKKLKKVDAVIVGGGSLN